MLVAGEWVDAQSGERLEVIDPATEETIATCPRAGVADAEVAVAAARQAFDSGPWGAATGTERATVLRDVATLLRERLAEFATAETRQQGNLVGDFEDETAAVASALDYAAGLAEDRQGQALKFEAGTASAVAREPIGVVAAITPWNYPLSIAATKIAPALAAGNVVISKPASLTPLTTLMFAELFERAGLPSGALQVLTGPGAEIGRYLAASPSVDMVTLTGSVEVGREVSSTAATTVKKLVLELGGKSANLVFDDCDLEVAVQGSMLAMFTNAGQVCTAGTRLILQRTIHDRFVEELAKRCAAIKVGPGSDRSATMGPLVSAQQLKTVERYVQTGIDERATLVCGGRRIDRKGYFFEPTIFTNVNNRMTIAREEIFGPVLVVIPFDTEDEAVAIANDSDYGLAAGLFSRNLAKSLRVASRLRAGAVWVNTWFASYHNAAEGGRNLSGVGVEGGLPGYEEFTLVKHLAISMLDEPCGVYPPVD
jgi:betaine-aldehyde dehydrogenase